MTPLQWHEKRLKEDLSIQSEILLDKVKEYPVGISNLMKWGYQNFVGSHATLHKAIHALVKKDYLMIRMDESDARNKTLVITKHGIKYLEKP